MTSGLLYAVVGCLLFVFGLGGVLLLDTCCAASSPST